MWSQASPSQLLSFHPVALQTWRGKWRNEWFPDTGPQIHRVSFPVTSHSYTSYQCVGKGGEYWAPGLSQCTAGSRRWVQPCPQTPFQGACYFSPTLERGKKKSTFLNTPLLVRSQNQLEAILPVPFSVQMHMIKKRVGVAR